MTHETAPSREDPVVASLSEVVGGPVGDHAGGRRWLTPVRVLLLVTALTFAIGLVSKSACAADDFDRGPGASARLCDSPVADDYVGLGLVELAWPWSDDAGTRVRWPATDQQPVVGYVAYLAARATHVVTGGPDLGPRYRASAGSLGDEDDGRHDGLDGRIDHERLVFTAGVALGLAVLALLTTLALAAARGRRPWDAAGFAAAPVLALAGVTSWDLLSVAAAAGALWAFSRGRLALAGALVGVGAAAGVWPVLLLVAALVVAHLHGRAVELLPAGVTALATWGLLNAPAFLSGRAAWEGVWRQAADRGPEAGSWWTVLDGLTGISDRPAFLGAAAMVLVWTGAVVVLCRWAPAPPRLSQVAFLLVAGVALLGVTYRPEQALWLLPLAALARPRWRDLLIWQAGEALWLATASWQQGGFLEPGGGGEGGFAYVAILVRVITTAWLVAMVVRDVTRPERDVVRDQLTSTRSNLVVV